MKDNLLAKRKLETDLRMTDSPFSQYEKINFRDKGYQHSDSMKSKITMDD